MIKLIISQGKVDKFREVYVKASAAEREEMLSVLKNMKCPLALVRHCFETPEYGFTDGTATLMLRVAILKAQDYYEGAEKVRNVEDVANYLIEHGADITEVQKSLEGQLTYSPNLSLYLGRKLDEQMEDAFLKHLESGQTKKIIDFYESNEYKLRRLLELRHNWNTKKYEGSEFSNNVLQILQNKDDNRSYDKCCIAMIMNFQTDVVLKSHGITLQQLALQAEKNGNVKVFSACYSKCDAGGKKQILEYVKNTKCNIEIVKHCFKTAVYALNKDDATGIAKMIIAKSDAIDVSNDEFKTLRYLIEKQKADKSEISREAKSKGFKTVTSYIESLQNLERFKYAPILPLLLGAAAYTSSLLLSAAIIVQIATVITTVVFSAKLLSMLHDHCNSAHKAKYCTIE